MESKRFGDILSWKNVPKGAAPVTITGVTFYGASSVFNVLADKLHDQPVLLFLAFGMSIAVAGAVAILAVVTVLRSANTEREISAARYPTYRPKTERQEYDMVFDRSEPRLENSPNP